MSTTIQQQCPYCPEMLNFEMTSVTDKADGEGGTIVSIRATTTSESTAHVRTHAPREDPFGAPLEYVSNDRGVWAICKKCGSGLRGYPTFLQTRRNGIAHLTFFHPSWRITLPGPRRQLIHNGRKPR